MAERSDQQRRLLGLIQTMDAFTLCARGKDIFDGRNELFREALLHAVHSPTAAADELERWEHMLSCCAEAAAGEERDVSAHSLQVRSAGAEDGAEEGNCVSHGHWLAVQQELRMKDFVVKQLERQLGFERGVDEFLVAECESRERFCQEQVERLGDNLDPCAGHLNSAGIHAMNAMGDTDKCIEDSYTNRSVGWWQSEAQSVQHLYNNVEFQSSTDQALLSAQDRAAYFLYLQHTVNNVVRAFNLRRRQAESLGKRRLLTLKKHHADRLQRHICTARRARDSSASPCLQAADVGSHGLPPSSFDMLPGLDLNDIEDPEASLDNFDPMLSDSEGESGPDSLASRATDVPGSAAASESEASAGEEADQQTVDD